MDKSAPHSPTSDELLPPPGDLVTTAGTNEELAPPPGDLVTAGSNDSDDDEMNHYANVKRKVWKLPPYVEAAVCRKWLPLSLPDRDEYC